MDEGSVFLIAVAAIVIAVVWYLGVRHRVTASAELQRQYAEQAAETQRVLTDLRAQLSELTQRTADVHRILKDAE
jgi:hypothetical protein